MSDMGKWMEVVAAWSRQRREGRWGYGKNVRLARSRTTTAVEGEMVIREECAVGEVEDDDSGGRKRRIVGNSLRVSQKGDDEMRLCAG
jgi:hypothetical protein